MNKLLQYKSYKKSPDEELNEYYLKIFEEEGLIKSVEYDFFIDKVRSFLTQFDIEFDINLIEKNESNTIELQLDFLNLKNKIELYKRLLQLTNNLGYFVSSYIDVTTKDFIVNKRQPNLNSIKSIRAFVLFFNKKFDLELYINNITKFYHVTPREIYLKKISKIGLIPKHHDMISSDLDRIYLSVSIDDCYSFMYEKRNHLNKIGIEINNFVILEIDITLIAANINIYKDPKQKNAYYTQEPIPKRIISLYREINL